MMESIGFVRCPYKEKFGIPRQPHLAKNVSAQIDIPFSKAAPEAFEELSGFNFIWLIGQFHLANSTSSKVRPPRLGGNERIGVFATRSPFRPNPLSLSLVKLIAIEHCEKRRQTTLHVHGIDLVDGTPVYDIKPYIQDHDTPWEEATSGWIQDHEIQFLAVEWSDLALSKVVSPEQKNLIESVLCLDPRPPFHEDQIDKIYHCQLEDFDVHFSVQNAQVKILDLSITKR